MNRGAILVIARLTLREAFRRRLLWALVGLTLLIVAVTGWLFGKAAELNPLARRRASSSSCRSCW